MTNNMISKVLTFVLLCLFASVNARHIRFTPSSHGKSKVPMASCSGTATYSITFRNFLTSERFGSLIPKTGLVYSPITVVAHSNRISILTVRGFATKPIEAIAETGDNSMLLSVLRSLRKDNAGVKNFAVASGGTLPGKLTTLSVQVDCRNPFITAVGMIAPSPDWIVQISNMNMFSNAYGRFMSYKIGTLVAYDAGTDDGREFTPPGDLSLDMPTMPKKNIAPLVEDETDRFGGRPVGAYYVVRTK